MKSPPPKRPGAYPATGGRFDDGDVGARLPVFPRGPRCLSCRSTAPQMGVKPARVGGVARGMNDTKCIADTLACLHLNANRGVSGIFLPSTAAVMSFVANMEKVMPLPP